MHRIPMNDRMRKWEFACPDPKRHRDWRVINGEFQCRPCDATYGELVHLPTGERVPREEVEIVGPHADHQSAFDPRVDR